MSLGNSNPPRVAVYFRMSRDVQDKSIDRQRGEVLPHCQRQGYRVVAEHQDDGVTGSEVARRRGLQAVLALATSRKVDGVVVDDLDRLARLDLLELGELLSPLRRAGVWVESVAKGRVDFATMGGRLGLALAGEVSRDEQLSKARRSLTGHLRMARDDGPPLPKPAFGYKPERAPDGTPRRAPDGVRAEAVTAIFRWYAEGRTVGWIKAELERRGIPTPGGCVYWRRSTVRGILANRVYVGDVVWGKTASGRFYRQRGGQVEPADGTRKAEARPAEEWFVRRDLVPPLVDRDLWARCQARLARNGADPRGKRRKDGRPQGRAATTPTTEPGAFLLSRLLVCGRCGAFLTGFVHHRGDRPVVYKCGNYAAHGKAGCVYALMREQDAARAIVAELRRLLSADRRARLKARLEERVRALRSDDNKAALCRRIDTLRGKLERYRQRLLDVSRDMIGEVEDGIRQTRAALRDAEAELHRAETADPDRDLSAVVDSAAAAVWRLEQALERDDRPGFRGALWGLLSKVVVPPEPYTTAAGRERYRPGRLGIWLREGTELELFAELDGCPKGSVQAGTVRVDRVG